MEIKLPKAPLSSPPNLRKIRNGFFGGAHKVLPIETASSPQMLQNEDSVDALDHETLSELLERTTDLLSVFDRELRYEILEEAGVVQMQIIDSRDGKVVRKVPADEVIKFLKAMKQQIDDRVDVWA
jgi:uncharacterized FlaG/YvyC family protein